MVDRSIAPALSWEPLVTRRPCIYLNVDAFSRRIVGWRVASNMRTEVVLDALEMARRSRGSRRLAGLVAHSDAEALNRLLQSSQQAGVATTP
jgi:transposase InsO family protein